MRKLLCLLSIATLMTYSCKESRTEGENPFFAEWNTPFKVPPFDKIEPQHYMPAFLKAMEINLAEIDAIVADTAEPGFENVILALDNSGQMLETVGNVFSLVSSADSNDELQAVQMEVSPLLSQHGDKITMNDALFQKVKAVYERKAELGLNPVQERLLELTYKNFILSGADLSPEKKEELARINEQLSLATVKFGNNLLAENKNFYLELTQDQLAGLPANVRDAAKETAESMGIKDKWVFTLSKPSLLPFITYSDNRELREKLYRGYLERGNNGNDNDNKALVNEIVRLRTEKAHMLGYDSYAAYGLDKVMAKTPENALGLLKDLWTPALAKAKEELAEMKAIKLRETGDESFESWDWWYYAEKLRKEKYSLNEEAVRPYLSLEQVKGGIFDLSNRLYGVTFRPITAPVYNSECVVYEVLDMDNSHLGVLYLDFFPRPGKSNGAWCGSYRSRKIVDGEEVEQPVVTIVCNFSRPTGNTPALLTLDETETFFHEFGHALHNLFNKSPYSGLRRVERDFVELPSQIMENWAFEPQMLRQYALHYRTGEPMQQYLIDKIIKCGTFNQGFATTELLAASISDMEIHSIKNFEDIDVVAYEKELLNGKYGLIEEIAPRYRYPYFKHIFSGGYSAGYYSYLWAEVLDKDAYEAFVESGDIFDRETAARFREEVLSKGGTADGMTLYRNFRGADPSREPLLRKRGLIKEVDAEN